MSDYLTVKELRTKREDQLVKLLAERREKLRDLKFRIPTKQVKNMHEPKFVRREIARILSVIKEKASQN